MSRLFLVLSALFSAALVALPAFAQAKPYTINVLELRYYPVKGDNIDISVTGDWGKPLKETQAKVEGMSRDLARTLSEGSRYRGYKAPQHVPSLRYNIVKSITHYAPLPLRDTGNPPIVDYRKVLEDNDIRNWVEKHNVQEVWIWAYHGGKLTLWESNMSGPFGDVSNSNRDAQDLPVFDKTYTVYHYNYQRGLAEAVHNHVHQIEALLNHFDGRESTPKDKWSDLLFWGKFVGSDASHKIIDPRVGWCHYPPNGEKDYDYANPRYVETDIEDWTPQGGKRTRMNCERWNCDHLQWLVFWLQSIPGRENTLSHNGKRLYNWWRFTADFDDAKRNGLGLTEAD